MGVLTVFSLMVISYVSLRNAEQFNNTLNDSIDKEMQKLNISRKVKIVFLELVKNEKNLIFAETSEEVSSLKYLQEREKIQEKLQKNLYALDALVVHQRLEVRLINDGYDNYKEILARMDDLRKKPQTLKDAQTLSMTDSRNTIETIFKNIDKIIVRNETELQEVKQSTKEELIAYGRFIKLLTLGIFLLVFAFISFFFWLLQKRVSLLFDLVTYIKDGDFARAANTKMPTQRDELSVVALSLAEASSLLQKASDAQAHQTWLKNSFLVLSNTLLQEKQELLDITQSALKEICKTTNAALGVCYIYDDTTQSLQLYASYAYKDMKTHEQKYKLGEGVIGQVALDKEAKALRNVNDIDTIVFTGTTHAKALNTYTYPILFKDEIQGVVEIASFEPINTGMIEYLEGFAQTLGSMIYSTRLLEETKKLLKTTQQQSQELEISQQKLETQSRELEHSQQELTNQKDRLHAIIEGTNVGTWEWNIQADEIIVNERWVNIIGYTLEEYPSISLDAWLRFLYPEDLQKIEKTLKEHFEGKSDFYECEFRMRHKEGHWVWILSRGAVYRRSQNNEPLFMSGAHIDISERKAAQEELENASRYKSEFIANMSHELRTPLNSVNILSKLLADNIEGNLTPKQQEQALMIYNSGKDLLQLINDILDLSKIEAGMMSLHLAQVALIETIEELFAMFEPLAAQKMLSFSCKRVA